MIYWRGYFGRSSGQRVGCLKRVNSPFIDSILGECWPLIKLFIEPVKSVVGLVWTVVPFDCCNVQEKKRWRIVISYMLLIKYLLPYLFDTSMQNRLINTLNRNYLRLYDLGSTICLIISDHIIITNWFVFCAIFGCDYSSSIWKDMIWEWMKPI